MCRHSSTDSQWTSWNHRWMIFESSWNPPRERSQLRGDPGSRSPLQFHRAQRVSLLDSRWLTLVDTFISGHNSCWVMLVDNSGSRQPRCDRGCLAHPSSRLLRLPPRQPHNGRFSQSVQGLSWCVMQAADGLGVAARHICAICFPWKGAGWAGEEAAQAEAQFWQNKHNPG